MCLTLLCVGAAVSAIEVRVEDDAEADIGDANVRLECFVENLYDCHWEGPFGDRYVKDNKLPQSSKHFFRKCIR